MLELSAKSNRLDARVVVAICLVGVGSAVFAQRDSEDTRFVRELRQRRLFELGTAYCQQKLQRTDLSDQQRGQLTLELMRCLGEHALNAPAESRKACWRRARQVAADFATHSAQSSMALLVRMQDALTLMAQGELERMEMEMRAGSSPRGEQARQIIRDALRLLEDLDEVIAREIPRRQRSTTADGLTVDQLNSLRQHARWERARGLRNLALTYPNESSDYTAALTAALEVLEQVVPQLAADDPLLNKVLVEQAANQRLLGDLDRSQKILASMAPDAMTSSDRTAYETEKIRLSLAREGPQAAARTIAESDANVPSGAPDLDFARLEVLVALWRSLADQNRSQEAATWRKQAVAAVQRIERVHGPYWGRRADLLLLRQADVQSAASLEILERAADEMYLRGKIEEALAGYDRARGLAREAGEPGRAFRFGYKAALLQQERAEYADAGARFRELALAAKSTPQAAGTHLQGVVNVAQQARNDRAAAEHYVAMLHEHVSTWPQTATSAKARLWLGQWYESQRQWKDAVEAFRHIAPQHPSITEAIEPLGRCWLRWLDELRAAGQDSRAAATAAAQFLESLANRSEALQADSRGAAAVAAARIRCDYTEPDFAALEESLTAALEHANEESGNWRHAARGWLAVAVAGQAGRDADANRAVALLGDLPPDQAFQLLRCVDRIRLAIPDQRRKRSLAELQIALADLALSDEQSSDELLGAEVTRLKAMGLAGSGKTDQAIRSLAQLANRHPENLEIQRSYASLLLEAERTDLLEQALGQWRAIAARCVPRSKDWFRAKYSVALAQFRLGKRQDAARLIRYLQLTEDLSESGLERPFLDLLARCQNADP
jgi:TolA-binding protein